MLLLAALAMAIPPRQASSAPAARPADPAKLFQLGQDALAHGQLDEAERDFRQVLQLDPQSGAAYANLGVVWMRRQQWTKALEMLHRGEHLSVMPQVARIRVNIGRVYYQQNDFLQAIPPFESVLRDEPDAADARQLLGQCYFFAERWADAAKTLDPLWAQKLGDPIYLYTLSKAAHLAGLKDLDERAWEQLMKVGEDGAPGFHLLMGKDLLQLEHYDMALSELQTEAKANPRLPFVHFYLGQTYQKQQDYEHARDEFLKDAEVEPDLALDYDELGEVYALLQDDKNAEKNYREALRRDPRLVNSHLGLAKLYQRQERSAAALAEIEAAVKLDPERTDLHYVHGQVLLHLGRKEEAKKELDAAVRIDNERRAAREKQMDTGKVPSPELLQDPQ